MQRVASVALLLLSLSQPLQPHTYITLYNTAAGSFGLQMSAEIRDPLAQHVHACLPMDLIICLAMCPKSCIIVCVGLRHRTSRQSSFIKLCNCSSEQKLMKPSLRASARDLMTTRTASPLVASYCWPSFPHTGQLVTPSSQSNKTWAERLLKWPLNGLQVKGGKD